MFGAMTPCTRIAKTVTHWVDSRWRSKGTGFKALLLPLALPLLIIWAAAPRLIIVGWIWSTLWVGFCGWRWWTYMQDIGKR
jgi:hypothetical protein